MPKIDRSSKVRPAVVGTGLVALDIVLRKGHTPVITAGGTCANVLAILSYLGWSSTLVSRLAEDRAAKYVLHDLSTWGVSTRFARLAPTCETPVIVERIRQDAHGHPFHTFSLSCPACGRRLPSYQPVTSSSMTGLLDGHPNLGKVAFIDRVSRGALDLAQHTVANGGIVIFEPSSIRDEKLFKEMILIAHIVKYAQETLADYGELSWSHATRLEIQTLGRGGVRFRSNLAELHRAWHHAQAVPVNELVDACGAGDWFTAVLVDRLCRRGVKGLISASKAVLFDAVNLAQRIAAWNCAYAGARGGMYSSEGRRELRSLARIDRRLVATQYEVESDDAAAQICGCTISTSTNEVATRLQSDLPS